jgi:16S rRNA (guanine(527)-N(7))-methyltransferase RsmG
VEPGFKSMILLFERSGLTLSEGQYRRFWAFHNLIRRNNDALDLTRIRNFESMVIKHYVDSGLVPRLIDLPSPLLDIGSGAGFPGIPIKIVYPDTELILSEGRKRRAAFLTEACRLLGLKGIGVYPHRVSGDFEQPVGGVITRAVETMSETLDRVAPFLAPGGQVIFMKGPNCQIEIDHALSRTEEEFSLKDDIPYAIPGTPQRRRLVVFVKREPRWRTISMQPDQTGEDRNGHRLVKRITSPRNEDFKRFAKLTSSRGIKKLGLGLFAGEKAVKEVLSAYPERCAGIISSERYDLPRMLERPGLLYYELRHDLFQALDVSETKSPLLLVRVPPFDRWAPQQGVSGCTLCIPFQDPYNVGAVIRSGAAFAVSRVLLLKEAAHPFLPRSVRAGGSALFGVPVFEGPAISEVNDLGLPVIALSPEGQDIRSYSFPPDFCLVPGLEGPGIPGNLKGGTVLSVPMEPGVESINAALAAAIALFVWRNPLRWPAGPGAHG